MDEQARIQKVDALAAKLNDHKIATLSKLETLPPHEQEKVIENYNKGLAAFFNEAHKSHLAPEAISAPLKAGIEEEEHICNDCKAEMATEAGEKEEVECDTLCKECKEEISASTEPQLLCNDCKEEISGATESRLLCDDCEEEECSSNACVCGDAGVHFSRFALNDDIVTHYGNEPDHRGLITASKHDVIPLAYLGMVEEMKD